MNKVVIVDCVRTPMARSKQGAYRYVRAETLSAHLMQALLQRNHQIQPKQIDDIYWGCVQQTLEQGFNIARNAALLARIPNTVPATTVNRLCGSSMQALHDAARAIMVGDAEICLVGGVEHMGHVPMTHGIDFNPALSKYVAKAATVMGLTAEFLAQQYCISREQQDEFALRSHQKAHQATISGQFNAEIIATPAHDAQGIPILLEQDEVIRADANIEHLAALKPVFDPIKGSVTAGSCSALSDGASAMLIMSEQKALDLQLNVRAKILSMAVAGCDPSIMGIGPVPASLKALEKAKLTLKDIDLIELNEAFAAQSLACLKQLNLLDEIEHKVNLNGGAIALGHPLGCSGARITTSLINQLEKQQLHLGLATMCIGLGQGIATIVEHH